MSYRKFLKPEPPVGYSNSPRSRRRFKLSPVVPGYQPSKSRITPASGWTSEPDDATTDYDFQDDYQAADQERSHSASPTIPIQYHDGSMLRYQPPAHRNKQAAPGKRGGGKFTTKLVTFYRNGDKHFKGLQLPVSKKNFNTWDTLINYLAQKIYLPYGVRHVYTLGGQRVTDVAQLVDGKAYVCASGEFASKVQYGKQENTDRVWQNNRPQPGIRVTDRKLLNRDSNLDPEVVNEVVQGANRGYRSTAGGGFADPNMAMAAMPVPGVRAKLKPRVITIISNTHRASRARILLNPRTAQSFEQVLRDMSTSITMTNPPIKQIFTWMTEEQVLSFNQLFNDFKDHDSFIACGTESLVKSTQLSHVSSDSASEDMSPRVVDNRARDRVKFAAPQHPDDEKLVNGGKPRRKIKRQDTGRDVTTTQIAYPRDPLSSDDAFSPRSSIDDGPSHHQSLPPLRPRKAFASSGSEDSVGSPLPVDKRRGGRAKHSHSGEPMEVDSSTSSSGNGLNRRTRLNHIQKYDGDAETGASNSESAAESGDQGGIRKRKSKARTFRNLGRAYRALIAPITVEIHGQEKQFLPPSDLDPTEVSKYRAPQKRLKLEWVYGYRGLDSRNNLFVLPSGEILYTVGAVAVMYDQETDQQRHYVGHNEDITSIAVHPSGDFVATGQMNGHLPETTPPDIAICHSAHVRVWETNSLSTHAILGLEFFEVGIACLSFSNENNGEWLMAVDQSEDHILSLWSWNDDNLIAKSNQQTDVEDVVVGVFNPFDDNLIVTAGKQHVFFWKIKNKKIQRDKKSGIFEGMKPAYVSCIEFSHTGDVLTGDSGGNITVWEKDNDSVYRMRYCIQHAHEKFVSAMCMLEDGTLLSGGGLDRRLLAWDSLQGYQSAKIERMFTESAGGIRSIAPVTPGSPDGRVVLGTTKNHIMVGSLQNKFEYILQGHCSELWALAAHPSELGFATAGYDQHVMFWRAEDHKLLWKVHVEKPCLSCAFNPIGTVVAVGTTVGRFVVLNTEDGMHVTSVQVGKEQLSVVKYSPDGTLLAMGSHDFKIYLFSVMDDGLVYRRLGTLEGHSNFLTHLDWSDDNRHLQSVSGDYDLHFWDAAEVRKEKPENVTDVTWNTQSCIMGYTVAGVWPTREQGTDINTLDKSHSGDLLVAGDNYGCISLLKYPCANLKAESHDVKHNSSHVTALQFLYGDACVVATGGTDACLMQFVLEDKTTRDSYDGIDDEDRYAP
ncbi:echinoderm microtubule-associated protein-like 2 isoform X2 [Amphiura filiformis]|uniref:echinoderm microtubule-associated protein-like 2 isoform X2 n=1 Tax=Amphiura filiformis TaxID=82378 RepID=UPI003B223836